MPWPCCPARHPPPIIGTVVGQPEYLDDAPGTMLGARPDGRFSVGRRRLCAGARLLGYTDGPDRTSGSRHR
jgi:hypothetical protein